MSTHLGNDSSFIFSYEIITIAENGEIVKNRCYEEKGTIKMNIQLSVL